MQLERNFQVLLVRTYTSGNSFAHTRTHQDVPPNADWLVSTHGILKKEKKMASLSQAKTLSRVSLPEKREYFYNSYWLPNFPHKALVDPGEGSFTYQVNRREWGSNCVAVADDIHYTTLPFVLFFIIILSGTFFIFIGFFINSTYTKLFKALSTPGWYGRGRNNWLELFCIL